MAKHIGNTKCILIWDKMTYIPTMSQFEFAFCSMNNHPQLIKINSNDSNRQHPTQKPVALYKWLLDKYAKEIDCKECDNGRMVDDDYYKSTIPCEYCSGMMKRKPRVLDTHLGSGSIAIACHDYGFELTACELDSEYYDKAIERIKNHVSQLTMF